MKKLNLRIKSDEGAAITILGIFIIIAIIILGGMLVDTNRVTAAKGQMNGISQVASKTGIQKQTGRGGLSHQAAIEAVDFYMSQLDKSETMQYRGKDRTCSVNGKSYPIIKVGFKKDNKQANPDFVKTVSGGNAKVTYSLQEQQAINRGLYKTLTFEVEDCIKNFYISGVTIGKTNTPATMIKGNSGQ